MNFRNSGPNFGVFLFVFSFAETAEVAKFLLIFWDYILGNIWGRVRILDF